MRDNYDLWEEHDAKKEAWLATLPVCSECHEPIQDETCYEINDELICVGCLIANHRKFTDDYIN